jgi:hypothetical protein
MGRSNASWVLACVMHMKVRREIAYLLTIHASKNSADWIPVMTEESEIPTPVAIFIVEVQGST